MSNTKEWQDRLAKHRYSQQDSTLAYKFTESLKKEVDKFLDDFMMKTFSCGKYDLKKEPWRLLALAEFRKYGVKVKEVLDLAEPSLTELVLEKEKFSLRNVR